MTSSILALSSYISLLKHIFYYSIPIFLFCEVKLQRLVCFNSQVKSQEVLRKEFIIRLTCIVFQVANEEEKNSWRVTTKFVCWFK